MSHKVSRRSFVKGSLLASALTAAADSAVAQTPPPPETVPAKDALPQGKIGDLQLSRLMLGGNLISGYSHSRELHYVGALMKRYNTEAKILETLEIAEAHGIDSVNVAVWDDNSALVAHQKRGGKIKWFMAANPRADGDLAQVKEAIDMGADVVYVQGAAADRLRFDGKLEWIAKEIDFIRSQGIIAGVGAHSLDTIIECEKAKINADFYQKTLHTLDYPSAPRPGETGDVGLWDNSWCRDPQAVIEFMANVTKPWIAFKVMAAGAIPPRKAFQHAFDGGADFVLAGMFDFQIAEDV